MVNVTQKDLRSSGFFHRINVTSPDVVLIDPAVPITITSGATGGSLEGNETYFAAYVGGIAGMGVTNISQIDSIAIGTLATPTGTVTIDVPQLTNVDGYTIFFSKNANPHWVALVSEADRAAGAFIGTYGVVTSPSALAGPGQVTIGCLGTGLSCADPIFVWSNAFVLPTPDARILCAGKTRADVYVQFDVTDLREKPYFIAVPFYKTELADDKFYCGPAIPVASPEMVGGSVVRQLGTFDVSACAELLVTVGGIQGNGAWASMWVELV
jgi:hypothetical protein